MNRFDFFNGVTTPQPVSGYMGNPMSYFNDTTNMRMQYSGNQFGANNTFNPGGFGYDPGPNFMNPPQPNLQTPNFQGYNMGGNPALQMVQQNPALMGGGGLGYQPFNPYYQPQQYQDKVVHVPGLQIRSDQVMWSDDLEQRLEKLQTEMILDQEKAELERQQRFQGYYNNNMGAYNYYGMSYFAGANNAGIESKYRQKVAEIIEEGKQRQIDFNKKMSRIAHNFLGIPVDEEELDRTFGGYDYTIPAVQFQEDAMQTELARFKPYSNQNMYQSQFTQMWEANQRLMKDVHTVDDFLEIQGVLTTIDMLEEDYHSRRNGTQYYQPDSYKRFLRKSILERNGMAQQPVQQTQKQEFVENVPFGRYFPTFNDSAKMMEDGTICLSIPENFGELAAQRGMGRQMVIEQEFEKHFEENRMKFLSSIYNQPRTTTEVPPDGS